MAIFYGINYFTVKHVFETGIDSFAVMAIRTAVTAAFFIGYHQLAVKERIQERRDYFRLFLASMFGVAINQTFFLWGLSLTSRVNASVLMILTPVFVFLTAWFLRQERFSAYRIAGLLIAFVGAGGLILSGAKEAFSLTGASIAGDVMIMVNAATYGIYLVLVRPLLVRYNLFTIIKWLFIFGAPVHMAISIGPLLSTPLEAFTPGVVGGIAFLIVFATILAYLLNAWAMKVLPSSAVGVYIYVQPVFVTMGSAFLSLGEVTWLSVSFILLIFAGVWLVGRRAA